MDSGWVKTFAYSWPPKSGRYHFLLKYKRTKCFWFNLSNDINLNITLQYTNKTHMTSISLEMCRVSQEGSSSRAFQASSHELQTCLYYSLKSNTAMVPLPREAQMITIYPVSLSFSFHSPQSRGLSYLSNSNLPRTKKKKNSRSSENFSPFISQHASHPRDQLVITNKQGQTSKALKTNK